MKEQRALRILKKHGVIVQGHFPGTSGRHLAEYVEKRLLHPHTNDVSKLCRAIAREFASEEIDTVIGPERGGIILSQWVAHNLTKVTANLLDGEIWAVYAEKTKDGGFAIPSLFEKFISGRLVLVVDDTLTTGGTVKRIVEAVREMGGGVVGVGALWNRGDVTAKDIGDVPRFYSLINKKLADWSPEECLLTGPCSKGVPINLRI